MKNFLKIESIFLLGLTIYIYFYIFKFSWIYFIIFLFVPDLSMIGYIFNNKIGAYVYNSIHNLALPVILFILGSYYSVEYMEMLSIILFTHIFMDRILGYGLKYTDEFKHTHL